MESVSIELRKTMVANIARQLELNNKTQREMCLALNFKENTVSDWMNAKTYPRIDKIEMMSNFFGCKKSNLIERLSEQSSGGLAEQERKLLSDFRDLNEAGKDAAIKAVESFTYNPKYKKQTKPEAEPVSRKETVSSSA